VNEEHDLVHINIKVPLWIADLLIAKVDEESIRLHLKAHKNRENDDQVLPDGTIILSQTRVLADQLGKVKTAIDSERRKLFTPRTT
jgi:hypothetical protein